MAVSCVGGYAQGLGKWLTNVKCPALPFCETFLQVSLAPKPVLGSSLNMLCLHSLPDHGESSLCDAKQ